MWVVVIWKLLKFRILCKMVPFLDPVTNELAPEKFNLCSMKLTFWSMSKSVYSILLSYSQLHMLRWLPWWNACEITKQEQSMTKTIAIHQSLRSRYRRGLNMYTSYIVAFSDESIDDGLFLNTVQNLFETRLDYRQDHGWRLTLNTWHGLHCILLHGYRCRQDCHVSCVLHMCTHTPNPNPTQCWQTDHQV